MCKQQISQIEQEISEIDSSNHITIDMNRKPDLENKLNSLFNIKKCKGHRFAQEQMG